MPGPGGFDYETRGGEVVITHHGRRATVLRGTAAARFVADVEDGADAQEPTARIVPLFTPTSARRGTTRATAGADPYFEGLGVSTSTSAHFTLGLRPT